VVRGAAAAGTARFALPAGDAAPPLNLDYPGLAGEQPALARDPQWDWVEAVVPIRLAHTDVRYLLLGRRHGGMRYLSEDLRSLNYMAGVAAEEVERFRAAEMQRLVSDAELRALHSQINPHFLFNALNTIYGIIPREATGARRTVLHLAEIFRYFLQSDKEMIPLSEELKIVEAYLEIEKLRLGPRLSVEIDVDPDAARTQIPILSVQPLVENAIKHGLSARPEEGWLRLRARVADGALTVTVEDSGTGLLGREKGDRHELAGDIDHGTAPNLSSDPNRTEDLADANSSQSPFSRILGRVHIAMALVHKGYVKNTQEAFDRLTAIHVAESGQKQAGKNRQQRPPCFRRRRVHRIPPRLAPGIRLPSTK